MASYVKLQSLKNVTDVAEQEIRQAIDAGGFETVAVMLYVSEFSGTGAQVEIETAADNSDEKYVRPTSSAYFSVSGTGAQFLQIDGFARFLRWNVTSFVGSGKSMTFEIDLVLKVAA